MYNLLFWVAVHLTLLWVLERITRNYRDKKVFKIIFAPCVILECLHRVLACCLCAAPVTKMEFFEDGKPFIIEGKSRVPYLGPAVFLVVWLGVFFGGFYLWTTHSRAFESQVLSLPHVEPVAVAQGMVRLDARSYIEGVFRYFRVHSFASWQVWLLIYLVVGSTPFFSLKLKQLQVGYLMVAIFALATGVVQYLGFSPDFLSRGWYLNRWVLPEFFGVYSLLVTYVAATVLLHYLSQLSLRGLDTLMARRAQAHEKKKSGKKTEPREPVNA